MPKGGLLHCHLDATVDFRTVLDIAIKQPGNLHVRAKQVITQESITSVLPEFRAIPETEFTNVTSLTDPSYTSDAWVALTNARDNFDPALGGPTGFDRWVLRAMTINPSEAYGTHNTVDKVTDNFTCLLALNPCLIDLG
jgi:adenosine deaminase CECR1